MDNGKIYEVKIAPTNISTVNDGTIEIKFGDDSMTHLELSKVKSALQLYELHDGDIIYFSGKGTKRYKIGEKYDSNKHLIVIEIVYNRRPWWKFWTKRQIIGYKVEYIRKESNE